MSELRTISNNVAGDYTLNEHFATVPREDHAGLAVENDGIDWVVVGGVAVSAFLLGVVAMLGYQLVRWVLVIA